MAVRYDGTEPQTTLLVLSALPCAHGSALGRLPDLLAWHVADPVSAAEVARNDRTCEYQLNRNPFVDHPELVDRMPFADYDCENGVGSDPMCGVDCAALAQDADFIAAPAGSVAIVGLNAGTPKAVALVALAPLGVGVVVSVTDNGWTADGQFRSTEGTVRYIVPEGGVAAGAVLVWTDGAAGWVETGSFNPSASGESLLAYSGPDADPEFLFALDVSTDGFDETSDSSTTSALPAGGVAHVALAHHDNVVYDGPLAGTGAEVLQYAAQAGHWVGNDNAPFAFAELVFQVVMPEGEGDEGAAADAGSGGESESDGAEPTRGGVPEEESTLDDRRGQAEDDATLDDPAGAPPRAGGLGAASAALAMLAVI
jgi:hypothetical protein